MNRLNVSGLMVLLYGLIAASPVFALQATANGSLGVEFTDNATSAATNEVEDQILTAQVGGTLAKPAGSLTGQANFSLRRQEYLDDTFGKRNYLNLGSNLNMEPIKNRLSIAVQDYFTQTAIDNLAVNVPTNRQDTNIFALSAGISFPLASRHSLLISPSFSDFNYDTSDTNNQQFGLSAGWSYQFKPTMQLSVTGSTSKVEYDSSANNDYDVNNISLTVSGTTARMRYSASLGESRVDSAARANNNNTSASLSVNFDVSGHSNLQAYLSQDLTNTSALFLGYAIDPATGNITNVQTSGEVVRNRSMRISYSRMGSTINTNVWTELRELDYSSAAIDRETQEVGARISYSITPLINASLDGRYVRNDQTTTSIVQEELSIGAGLGFQFSRRIGLNFSINHNSRESTVPADEFDEFNVSAGLGYTFWP